MNQKNKLFYCLVFIFVLQQIVVAQDQVFDVDGIKYLYKKPGTFDFILKAPSSFASFGSSMFNKEYIIPDVLIGTTTALFIVYDQPIYNETAKFGRNIGIGNDDNTKTFISVGNYPLFRGPTDVGSAMYFIGDGWTHVGLGLGFLTAGLINDDNRALQTASQIMQGILTVGLTTQVLKHITGRETPIRATQDAGIWRFFPDQIDYSKNVSKYDAFPSGHLAVAMMTVTVIANNYEEYKWIRPVGYGLMTLLSFQMINNGVHWLSDYPLALGIGYLFGKIIVDGGRQKVDTNSDETISKLKIYPSLGLNNSFMVSFNYSL
ncbi:MAG: phosphatase PAP2 family protein [Ignavibacteriaceae bacterium]|nr:phosphatase PAP2 family protein [Ignavibacteriaceae bacterium]HRN26141.1 phosphatase PAP2 family protein [Ignavibacteriaceae bacterium]HRP92907.1 phosphatase PAP2 family protein [Ignavibacteriaceae bacterium]HRQ53778.1 phosphatase PAP2 family protein [Ignavibacteriaceae bacterium]